MENALVSAIITTHNRPPCFVIRAIESVINQTYSNIELIVVDDSPDSFRQRDEVEQIVRTASKSIIYIKHDISLGACAARNTGVKLAKGDYVAFLDDDDEWLPTKIEEEIACFTDHSIALVYCGYYIIDEYGNRSIKPKSYKKGRIFNSLLDHSFPGVTTSNPIIRKDCLEKIGLFDVQMQSLQDYDLLLRLASQYAVNYVDKPLLNYYIHNMGCISVDVDKQIAGRERILSKFADKINCNTDAWYMNNKTLLVLYAEKGWRKKALKLWVKCILKKPWLIIENLRLFMSIIVKYDSCLYKALRLLYQKLFHNSQPRRV